MGRPRKLSVGLLKKIATKKGNQADMKTVAKQVDAKARRLGIASPVALIMMARDLKIGTATATSRLNDTEKNELRSASSVTVSSRPAQILQRNAQKRIQVSVMKIVQYDTDSHFIKGHIDEINRAYNAKCYTSVFILSRKVVENLIIDILKKKFPEGIRENKELYFNISQSRLKDFGDILKNLRSKKDDFGTENKAVEKLCDLASALKDNANNKTHSWYHLVERQSEIDDLNLTAIFELVKKLEQVVGLRS